jgi:hypothetical protein
MVTINLLPWRTYERMYRKKVVKKFILLSTLLPLLVIVLLHGWLTQREAKTQTHIAALRAIITQHAIQHGKRGLTFAEQNTAAMLLSQKTIYRLFTELGLLKTSAVCFREIKGNKNSVYFIGQTHNASDLTEFLSHWHPALLFSEIRIKKMQQQEQGNLQFVFQALRE